MGDQLTTSAEALRLFFNDDVYLVNTKEYLPAQTPLPEVKTVIPVVFKYLGKNKKNILILVNDEENDVSTEKGRELLRNIVKSLQLTANDFALLNYSAYKNVAFEDLNDFFSCHLALIFGVMPSHLGLREHTQHMIHMKGKTQVVFSGNLNLLADDQGGKKALWGSLKQILL